MPDTRDPRAMLLGRTITTGPPLDALLCPHSQPSAHTARVGRAPRWRLTVEGDEVALWPGYEPLPSTFDRANTVAKDGLR